MDCLVPGIGEIIGGSQREERLDLLEKRMAELQLDEKDYWWYLDLRRYGGTKHAGFGIGFERLIMYLTGIANIRDVLPFPATTGYRGILMVHLCDSLLQKEHRVPMLFFHAKTGEKPNFESWNASNCTFYRYMSMFF